MMKKMNEMNMVRKVIAVIIAALIFGGGTFTAILWSVETDNVEAKEAKAGIEKIAGEKTVKESEEAKVEKEAEETGEESAAEETAKSVSENNNANRNNASSFNSSNKTSSNSGTSTSNKATGSSGSKPTVPAHTHSWTAVYETVTVPVERSKWTRLCNACGIENPTLAHQEAHLHNFEPSGTHTGTIYWTEYVEEQHLSHYQCSCGATK